MPTINESIALAARGWIGTRFHHQGRLKKNAVHQGGVDCLGLLVGVAAELDLRAHDGRAISAFDKTDYPHYPDSTKLKSTLSQLLLEIPPKGIECGDILLLKIDRNPQHLAIAGDLNGQLSLIHAYAPARFVVEHPLDVWWMQKIDSVFRYSYSFHRG